MRAVQDQHVDRPDVDARQRVQLTGPNRSIALEQPTDPHSPTHNSDVRELPDVRAFAPTSPAHSRTSDIRNLISESAATAGWPWRGGPTRSHPELDRETPQRRWYCVSRRGRVGRRPALPAGSENRGQRTGIRHRRTEALSPGICPLMLIRKPEPSHAQSRKALTATPGAKATGPSRHTSPTPAAGWSSPVARQAHNLKVGGSNPPPATRIPAIYQYLTR
jgi:hypothetical protein